MCEINDLLAGVSGFEPKNELLPNHAWRNTFKAVGFRSGIPEKLLDAIVGRALL
jgi:hypothetical protein